jgi:CBS-domain-containing membrane protein
MSVTARPPIDPGSRPRLLPRSSAPSRPEGGTILRVAGSCAAAIALVAGLGELTGELLFSASLGASAAIVFAVPEAPFAQPRSILGGQGVSALSGLMAVALLGGTTWLALALSVGLAVAAMLALRTFHAPAASTALIVVLEDPTLDYVVLPVLAGSLLLVLTGLLVNNVVRGQHYPRYWW